MLYHQNVCSRSFAYSVMCTYVNVCMCSCMRHTCMLGYICMHTCLEARGQPQMSYLRHWPPVFETRSFTRLESPNKLGICMSPSACTGFMDLEPTCLVFFFFHVSSGNQIQLFVLLRQAPLPHEPSPLSVFGRTYHSHKGFWTTS